MFVFFFLTVFGRFLRLHHRYFGPRITNFVSPVHVIFLLAQDQSEYDIDGPILHARVDNRDTGFASVQELRQRGHC